MERKKMKKVHITEEQLNELKNTLSVTPDNTSNMDNTQRAELGKNIAANNPNTSVYVDGIEVNATSNPSDVAQNSRENAQSILANVSEATTKRQIREAKINRLKSNCIAFKKKDIEKTR